MTSNFARRFPFSLLGVLAVGLVVVPTARPDAWNKRTEVKFFEPVEFPGGVVVPPGEYVMKLVDSPVNRNIVQVLSEDRNRVYATVLAISTQRSKPAETTILTFHETRGTDPLLIHKWFSPGDTTGREFPHSKSRTRTMARASYASPPADLWFDEDPESAESRFAPRDERVEAANRGVPTPFEPEPESTPSAVALARPPVEPESGQPVTTEPADRPVAARAMPAVIENLPETAGAVYALAFAGVLFLTLGLLSMLTRRVALAKRTGPPAGL